MNKIKFTLSQYFFCISYYIYTLINILSISNGNKIIIVKHSNIKNIIILYYIQILYKIILRLSVTGFIKLKASAIHNCNKYSSRNTKILSYNWKIERVKVHLAMTFPSYL